MTLQASPTTLLGLDYAVTEDGGDVATIELRRVRLSRGRMSVGGTDYEWRPPSLLSRTLLLESDGRLVAKAERRGLFRASFEIHGGDRRLALRATSLFRRRYTVYHGNREVGRIWRDGTLGRDVVADIDAGIPQHLRVFVLVLSLFDARRRQRAASSNGGS